MKPLDKEDIEDGIKHFKHDIARRHRLHKEGFYEKEDLPIQSVYIGASMDYASLARYQFLRGDPIDEVRKTFSTAANCVLKSFTMAYDPDDPDYVGDKPEAEESPGSYFVDWSEVSETMAIDGLNYALMGANFSKAETLAEWYQDSKDGHKMDAVVNRYVYAYKYALLKQPEKGVNLLQLTLDEYTAKPPKHIGDINYFNMSIILHSILTGDEETLNKSLALQLEFHQKSVIPSEDLWGTDEAYICDEAVALANLAIRHGLNVMVEHDLLPEGLLVQPMDG